MRSVSGFEIMLLVVMVISILSLSEGYRAASPSDVQDLLAHGDRVDHGADAVKAFLEKNPTPSRNGVRELKERLTKQEVLQISRAATGKADLQQPSEIASVRTKESEEWERRIMSTPFTQLPPEDMASYLALYLVRSNILVVLLLFAVVIIILFRITNTHR